MPGNLANNSTLLENNAKIELKADDIVFAQKHGFLPWPGRLIDVSNSRSGLVQFMYTLDRHQIPYAKIWPYNDIYKEQFITKNTLEYEDFSAAIYITECMLNKDFFVPAPAPIPTPAPTPAPAPSEAELRFLVEVRQQHESLVVEPLFIGEINKLRSSLTKRYQNYTIAGEALEKLLKLPITQLLLVRSQEAVKSIRLLTHFVSVQAENQAEPELVRQQSRKLMRRFASVFPQPFGKADFWSEYCMLSDLYMRHTKPKT